MAAVCHGSAAWALTFEELGLYTPVDDITAGAYALAAAHPDLVELVEFGRSYEDRPLLALRITAGAQQVYPDRPEFLFTGGLHARELVGAETAWRLAETLVQSYGRDPQVTAALDDREVWIAPMVNPDGRKWVEMGRSSHRKNTHRYDGQYPKITWTGVDLNRNFPYRWEENTAWPYRDTYAGPAPLSEPESAALWSLLQDPGYFSDLLSGIDYHSGIEAVLYPWISPSDRAINPLPAEDQATFSRLADPLNQIMGIEQATLHYDAYGTLTDSLYDQFGMYALTQELYVDAEAWPDYLSYFNPVDEAALEGVVERGVASALYLLSDEAFVVPEPATLLLLAVAGLAVQRRGPGSATRT
jgi:carboxypeptidase T